MGAILVVTGVSGAGKTAAVRALEARGRAGVRCFHFDHIGVPSVEAMERDYGGPEAWQADATNRWILRLAAYTDDSVMVLDGQTRPSFVRVALARVHAPPAQTILLECSPDLRQSRLAGRGQPELATPQMDTWAAYLRGQADALGLPVIDTTDLSVEAVADLLEAQVEVLRTAAASIAIPRTVLPST